MKQPKEIKLRILPKTHVIMLKRQTTKQFFSGDKPKKKTTENQRFSP